MSKSEQSIVDPNLEDQNWIDHSTKEEIELTCSKLNIPFTRENAIAVIYGGNEAPEERILPDWLRQM